MKAFEGFSAFRANRRLHYHIQNAAVVVILVSLLMPVLWPSVELASKVLITISVGVLFAKFCLQPAVICYIPSKISSDYIAVSLRRDDVKFPRLYIAYTGYEDADGRPEVGVYADQEIEYLGPITEYGRVVQSRQTSLTMPDHLRRWIRTLHYNAVDIDGNPNHPLNGGIVALAMAHAVGSLLNHSRSHAKCSYWQQDLISSDLKSQDGTRQIGCIFIRADRKIYRHEHLLINYEPNTASLIGNMLHFV